MGSCGSSDVKLTIVQTNRILESNVNGSEMIQKYSEAEKQFFKEECILKHLLVWKSLGVQRIYSGNFSATSPWNSCPTLLTTLKILQLHVSLE